MTKRDIDPVIRQAIHIEGTEKTAVKLAHAIALQCKGDSEFAARNSQRAFSLLRLAGVDIDTILSPVAATDRPTTEPTLEAQE